MCRSDALDTHRNRAASAQTHDNACKFLEDAATIPGREIYIGTAGDSVQSLFLDRRTRRTQPNVGLYGAGLGPRWACGAAMYGLDPYCRAMLEELGRTGELAGRTPELDDVLVIDKEVYLPDNRPDVRALRSSDTVVEIDMAISGVRRAAQMPTHPLIAAYQAYDSFAKQAGFDAQGADWAAKFTQNTVPLFLFDAQVKDARVVNERTHETVAKLELREPRQPQYALLKQIEPERVAAPSEPYGPDVVGLRLGMGFEQADRLIREHMSVGRMLTADRAWQVSASTGRLEPFTSGRLYESEDGNERIIIFDEPPASPNVVLGIVRQLTFAKGKVAPAAIYAQLEKKYGAASGPNPSGAGQLWIEGAAKDDGRSRLYCSPSHNASNLHSIWRDPDADPEQPAPAPPQYDAYAASGGLEAMQAYVQEQREYMAALQKRQADYQRNNERIPSLDCPGCDDPSQTAECPTGLAATFDVNGRDEDQLVIQVFDLRVYAQQFSESERLIEKGENGMSADDTITDLEL